MVRGGAGAVQLRDKTATDLELVEQGKALLEITRAARIPLIINDRPEVAKAVNADGLHLGQEDGSLKAARAIVGDRCFVGRSTHSEAQATAAEKEGFDYIGVGPVFATPTKPSYEAVGLKLVSFAAKNIRIPFVAIGGIDASNIRQVRDAGARNVAVVRAVMGAIQPEQSTQELLEKFER